jgi:hypothetical protein
VRADARKRGGKRGAAATGWCPFKGGTVERELGGPVGSGATRLKEERGPRWRVEGAVARPRRRVEQQVGDALTRKAGAYDAWARGHCTGAAAV